MRHVFRVRWSLWEGGRRLTTDAGAFDVPVGFGRWEEGEVTFSTRKHQPLGWLVGVQRIAASAAVQDDGSVKLTLHIWCSGANYWKNYYELMQEISIAAAKKGIVLPFPQNEAI